MANKLKIMVVGATGQQGGAVARALLSKGHAVRGLTRSPGSVASKELASMGAEMIKGDLTDRASVVSALQGVDGVFGVTTPFESGVGEETKQGINLVDAARKVGVKHLVFSSVGKANTNTGIPHFESKWAVEKYLVKSSVPYTIVAPVFFFENWLSPWFLPPLKEGNVALALPPERKLAHISLHDIGAFVAMAFENRDKFLGKRFDIASDELSGVEVAEKLGAHIGHKLGYFQIPLEAMREQNEDFALMFEWFDKIGYNVDLDGLKRDFEEVEWINFDEWIKTQDWSILTNKKTGTYE